MKNFFFRILKWFKNLDICTKKSVPLSIYVMRYIYFSLLPMACILDWKHRQSQDIPGVYEAICIDELKRNFHAEYFICFLVVILFIGPKSDLCLVLSVSADESFSSLVETWLMWPWRVKMLSSYNLPLLPVWNCRICYMDLLQLLHVFLALCQTKPS